LFDRNTESKAAYHIIKQLFINMVSVYTIQSGTVFAWFMLLMVIRRIVLLIIAGITGHNKPFPAGSRVPEDRILKRGQVEQSPTGVPHVNYTKDIRVNKTISNDAENDTYFLILLLSTAVLSDSSNGNCIRTIVYGVIYLFFRILYAIAYIQALQPLRSIAFYFGLACTLACNLDLVITMSQRAN
jgi:uncharacterized MAPEG superfamily protein